ncbi:MAG: DUF1294 domain-containing protein [Clostridia bacterium]
MSQMGWIFYVLINLATFMLMGVDKRRAQRGAYRIPERTLLLFCACFGALGGFFAMHFFHHKTRHPKFRYGIPAMLCVHLVVLFFLY